MTEDDDRSYKRLRIDTNPPDNDYTKWKPIDKISLFEYELLRWAETKGRSLVLYDVPVGQFLSTSHYAVVFLPLIIQEAAYEVFPSHYAGTRRLKKPMKPPCTFSLSEKEDKVRSHFTGKRIYNPRDIGRDLSGSKYSFIEQPVTAPLIKGCLRCNVKTFHDLKGHDLKDIQTLFHSSISKFLKLYEISTNSMSPSSLFAGDVIAISKNGKISYAYVTQSGRFDMVIEKRPGGKSNVLVNLTIKIIVLELDTNEWLFHTTGDKNIHKLGNVTTYQREYEAILAALRCDDFSHELLSCLLDCKDRWASENSKVFRPRSSIPGMSDDLIERVVQTFNKSQQNAIFRTAAQQAGFTLIQGPPGTGKTSTSLMSLNILHCSIVHNYYSQILPSIDSHDFPSFDTPMVPRILVTAPSNTAVDGFLFKLRENKFIDNQLRSYTPNIIRVGAGSSKEVEEFELESITNKHMDRIMSMSIAEYEEAVRKSDRELDELHRSQIQSIDKLCSYKQGYQQLVVLIKETVEKLKLDVLSQEERAKAKKTVKEMTIQKDELNKCYNTEIGNFCVVHDAKRNTSMHNSILKARGLERSQRNCVRQALLEHAQLVFVTLNSSGLRYLVDFGSRISFDILLVDEAGQATEPSVLVPLQHNVRHCVLVGDPKQLPATVKSGICQDHFLQQSLFERLQNAGHICYLLDTQYRSHPSISAFSSEIFYGGNLKDAEEVKNNVSRISSDIRDLQPLTFFDLKVSRELKKHESFQNMNEAQFACLIYEEIRKWERYEQPEFRFKIGVITPYREQVYALERCFVQHSDDKMLDINTVDSFQGREYDVIIFSCVRASNANGFTKNGNIGFLNDQRRLNVAATRARYLLLIVGNEKTLSCSRLWRNYIAHVKQYGKFCPNVDLLHQFKYAK